MTKDGGVLVGKSISGLELLKRNIEMLQIVAEHEPIGIIKLADLMGLPQHKVRYSLRLLEQDGLVRASTSGAKTTKKLEKYLDELNQQLGEMNTAVKDVQKSVDRLKKSLEK